MYGQIEFQNCTAGWALLECFKESGYPSIGNSCNDGPCNVGLDELENSDKIFIFPNPSSGIFTLQTSITKGELGIYNLLGEKVFASVVSHPSSVINLSSQPKGVYFVRVVSDKQSFTQKVVIQ